MSWKYPEWLYIAYRIVNSVCVSKDKIYVNSKANMYPPTDTLYKSIKIQCVSMVVDMHHRTVQLKC